MTELPSGSVTFLFTDIEGSTRLLGQHPKAYAAALLRHDALLRGAVAAQEGVVFETIGDAVYAAFSTPMDAVCAALDAQRRLRTEAWGELGSLKVRMALHTGVVERRGDHYFGTALYRCARLMAIGHGGQVLLSRTVADAARDALPSKASLREMGTHRLKDLAEPELVFQLLHPELPSDFPALRSLDPRATNLPIPANAFIGRANDRSAVGQLLGTCRLLTLTGPGGTGKTRLALQVAAEVIANFDDGVWFVPLAAISDPALVTSAIAQTFDVAERRGEPLERTLERHFANKEALLVIDNFEQVLDAASLLAALIARCPKLKILVTSRVPLHLAAERQFGVRPLPVPEDVKSKRADELSKLDAIALFLQRALAVRPDLPLDDASLEAVRQICARLDGLPLAIELAAARSRVLLPHGLLARIDRPLSLLTGESRDAPPRQRSMRATIAWSHELLSEPERDLFERLTVFAGGCTLGAAEEVGAGRATPDFLSVLSGLVDASLLSEQIQSDGEPRFFMLETIREYGLDRLAERGVIDSVRDAHAAHYLAFAESAERELMGPSAPQWLRRVSGEQANLVAALDWFVSRRNGDGALRMCWGLWRFWVIRGLLSQGRGLVESALALADGASERVLALGLTAAGEVARTQGDAQQARAWKEEALSLSRATGEGTLVAALLNDLGNVAMQEGEIERAKRLYGEGLSLRRELGHPSGIAHALGGLVGVTRYEADYAHAEALLDEAISLAQEESSFALSLEFQVGMLALEQGNPERALPLLQRNLERWHELGDVMYTAACLAGLAGVAAGTSQPRRAARLLGTVEALLEPTGVVLWPEDQKTYRRTLETTRSQLVEADFSSAWAEGRATSVEGALADLTTRSRETQLS